jgi:hypothetical protein
VEKGEKLNGVLPHSYTTLDFDFRRWKAAFGEIVTLMWGLLRC